MNSANKRSGMTVPLNRVVDRVAGHIRKPYTLQQIVRKIESNEYNSEMMLQHLLKWVSTNMSSSNITNTRN